MTPEEIFRLVLGSAAAMGHFAAAQGLSEPQTREEVSNGPEADQLVRELLPLLKDAFEEEERQAEAASARIDRSNAGM